MKIGTSLLRILLAVVLLWLPPTPVGVAVAGTGAAPNSSATLIEHAGNPHAGLDPFDRLETHLSYLTGKDPAAWRPDLAAFPEPRRRIHEADLSDQPARRVAEVPAAQEAAALGDTGRVSAIAAGGAHTCALTASGGVKCWGWNGTGQLGDGSTTQRTVPVDVSRLGSGVSAIAAGGLHSCALTAAGGVKCWGSNYDGQLGDGSTTQRTVPVDVSGLGSGVSAIAAGGLHSCALTAPGGVKCWGGPMLGDGSTTQRTVPVDVSGLGSGVSAIAAGGLHSCALTAAGGVKCWGANYFGELGDGTTTSRTTPVAVSGLGSGVSAIAAGYHHSCALAVGGGVKCWGWNGTGQLGDGSATDRTTPVNVSGLGNGINAVAAGREHSCALTSAGGVKCWGGPMLGDGSILDRTTPVNANGLGSGVSAIAAGGHPAIAGTSHSCALTAAGGVKCWGLGYFGQLGDGSTTDRTTPVDVVGLVGSPVFSITGNVGKYVPPGTPPSSANAIPNARICAGGRCGLTDSLGNYLLSGLGPGAYTVTVSLDGYSFKSSPDPLRVTVPGNATGQNFAGFDRPPIVFVHGFNGFRLPDPDCTYVSLPQDNPPVGSLEGGYFAGVDEALQAAGYYIAYARLESSGCFTPLVAQNVTTLSNAVSLAKAATKQPKVILIAHSMGGLVSRAYIEGPDYGGDVAELFTFGTPHLGFSRRRHGPPGQPVGSRWSARCGLIQKGWTISTRPTPRGAPASNITWSTGTPYQPVAIRSGGQGTGSCSGNPTKGWSRSAAVRGSPASWTASPPMRCIAMTSAPAPTTSGTVA